MMYLPAPSQQRKVERLAGPLKVISAGAHARGPKCRGWSATPATSPS